MSSYIVEKITIDRIVTIIANNQRFSWIVKGKPENYALCFLTDEEKEALGKRLWKMNRLAVERRYRDRKQNGKLEDVYFYEPVNLSFSSSKQMQKAQEYKSFQCFVYQCSEGLIAKCKLLKMIESFQNTIANEIIEALPEYQKAGWE